MTPADAYDVVIVGAGAAGLTCAVTAAAHQLSVLVLEKDTRVGGTTALSAGMAWIPCSSHNTEEGAAENVSTYLGDLAGEHLDPSMVRAFLEHGAAAIDFLEQNTCARWRVYGGLDYRSDARGAAVRPGRVLEPENFDDRLLGPAAALVKPALPAFTIFHDMQVDRDDLKDFSNALRSPRSFARSAVKVGSHYLRWLRHGRPVIRKRGNALVAMLLKATIEAGVQIRTAAPVDELVMDEGCVTGVRYRLNGQSRTVLARRGVVLASGGSSANVHLRSERTPFADRHIGLAPETNQGDGMAMAQSAGGRLGSGHHQPYCYAPVSACVRNGQEARFPHFGHDRCKPGALVVAADGRRFVNEGCSYHEFVLAMLARKAVPAYLIGDRTFLRRYGMGWARPAPFPVGEFIRSGYLVEAETLNELAEKLGIDASELHRSVNTMNQYAKTGVDLDFGKGTDPYSRSLGDSTVKPNPALGKLAQAPFYAVRLYPGDTGSTVGMIANTDGQCLDGEGHPIPGLFVCGNDMHNPTLGTHPSSGANIGPAIAFGYAAACSLASSPPPLKD
jgi:succinate dehydrogenase/fumarate reductase flavoprotein subunit